MEILICSSSTLDVFNSTLSVTNSVALIQQRRRQSIMIESVEAPGLGD